MVIGVAPFMIFPALLDRLLHGVGVRRWTRTPDLLFDFALGMTLLVIGLWGAYTVEPWLRHRGADIVPLTHAEKLLDAHGRGTGEIYRVESLKILPERPVREVSETAASRPSTRTLTSSSSPLGGRRAASPAWSRPPGPST